MTTPKLNNLLPVALPLLTALLFLPLALGLVGPNGVYGYRTAASMAGPEAWYRMNASAGWIGLAFSALALVISLLLLRSTSASPEKRSLVAVLVFAALMLVCAGVQFYVNG